MRTRPDDGPRHAPMPDPAVPAGAPSPVGDRPVSARLDELAALLAERLGGPVGLEGEGAVRVSRLAPLGQAGPDGLSFLAHPRHRAELARTAAAAVLIAPGVEAPRPAGCAALRVPDPYLAFAHLSQWWAARLRPAPAPGRHPSAVVDPSAELGEGVSVGALAVVEAGAVIGPGAVIGAQCHVGRGARIGARTRLAPQVVIGFGCQVGEDCLLHSGAVVGADGFGLAPSPQGYVKIEQLGAVRLGDRVEVGANTCIDRGALDDTVVGDGVKLDNLIQIAHNVRIGAHTAMAGCAAVAGSTVIGERCTLGGGAGVLGHLQLADGVHISARSTVSRSIDRPGHYTGFFPLDENRQWEKNAVTLRQLHRLRERVRALEARLAAADPTPAPPEAPEAP